MSRHFMQMNIDGRHYNPDRDLAYCSAHLVNRAMLGLDPEKQEPWVANYLKSQNLTNEDLVKAAEALAKYMNNTILDPEYKEPLDALTAAGFFDLPEAVQTITLAKIGQVYMSLFFTAIRDVTRDPYEEKPATVKSMTQIADAFMHKVYVKRAMPQWRRTLYDGWLWFKAKIGWFGVTPSK